MAVEEAVKAVAIRAGLGFAGGAAFGGSVTGVTAVASDLLFKNKAMSEKKMSAWNDFHDKEIKTMTENEECTEPISEEISLIFKEMSSELEEVLDSSKEESKQLYKEIEDLNKWAADLKKSVDGVQEVNRTFEELLRK